MGEVWRKIPGYPYYSVSSTGRVRRDVPTSSTYAGRILKPGAGAYGHRHVTLSHDGVLTFIGVHKLVALAFIGPQPTKAHDCAHWDGDPSNNTKKNLRWTLPAGNGKDTARHGRLKGHKNGRALFTDKDIKDIRCLRAKGATLKQIQTKYKAATSTLGYICSGFTWGHVK